MNQRALGECRQVTCSTPVNNPKIEAKGGTACGSWGPAPWGRREPRARPVHRAHKRGAQAAGADELLSNKDSVFIQISLVRKQKEENRRGSKVPKSAELPQKEGVVATLLNGNLRFRGCGRGSHVAGLCVFPFGAKDDNVGPE